MRLCGSGAGSRLPHICNYEVLIMGKKILIGLIALLIAVSGFLTGFFSVGLISVYATINDDSIYVPLRSENDAVKAFQAYCKSRDLTIEGSLTDAVTTFTTGAFNSACNVVGIDITELQAEIKAEYDSTGKPVKFLFTSSGVMAMNRIFAQFLQDNELSEGDTDVNKTVYSGRYFADDNNNGCLCYIYQGTQTSPSDDNILARGTTYLFDWTNVRSLGSYPYRYDFTYRNYSYYWYIYYRANNGGNYSAAANATSGGSVLYAATSSSNPANRYKGQCTVAFNSTTEKLYMAVHLDLIDNNPANTLILKTELKDNDAIPTNIIIVATQINANNYEGDTVINNEGDIINNPTPTPEPTDPNDVITNIPENPTSPNGDGGWDIDLPDIDIPSLPIGDLKQKFPFSIPWDLVAFYAMMDAPPEAPRFNGTLDLWVVDWDFDIDLSPFDSAAELCRKLQFGLFIVGLIVATRDLIRG